MCNNQNDKVMKTKHTSEGLRAMIAEALVSLVTDARDLAQKELGDLWVDEAVSEYVGADLHIIRRECSDESHALRFMTVVLPSFGKALDKALATDCPFPEEAYTAELQCSFNGPYGFMSWALDYLVDDVEYRPTGRFPGIVRSLRQISYLGYKLRLPFTEAQLAKASDSFAANDDLCATEGVLDPHMKRYRSVIMAPSCRPALDKLLLMEHMARATCSVFGQFDPWDIVPRHGPGAVSTGERGVAKLTVGKFRNYPIYDTYSLDYFMTVPNALYGDHLYRWDGVLDMTARAGSLQVPTTKVVFVPKDSRGPRVISCEPLEYQWIQQGLGRSIMEHLENHRRTRGQVNFTYQSINAKLALESSVTQEWVTLDLKDASDLVSYVHVKEMFIHLPDLWRCLAAARSEVAKLPDGRLVHLKKFAPMGSALCFPVETYFFWCVCVTAVHIYGGLSVKEACKSVYAYGDDLIIKTTYHRLCAAALQEFGLKLNESKCCYGRFFRESCGTDAYNGSVVTPARWQAPIPKSADDVEALFSLAALSNGLYERGFERTADVFARKLVALEPLTMLTTRQYGSFLQLIRPYHLDENGLSASRKRFHNPRNRRKPSYQRMQWLGVVASPISYEISGSWSQVSASVISLNSRNKGKPLDSGFELPSAVDGTVTSYPAATRVRRNVAWRFPV